MTANWITRTIRSQATKTAIVASALKSLCNGLSRTLMMMLPSSGLGFRRRPGLTQLPDQWEGKLGKALNRRQQRKAKTEGCPCWIEGRGAGGERIGDPLASKCLTFERQLPGPQASLENSHQQSHGRNGGRLVFFFHVEDRSYTLHCARAFK